MIKYDPIYYKKPFGAAQLHAQLSFRIRIIPESSREKADFHEGSLSARLIIRKDMTGFGEDVFYQVQGTGGDEEFLFVWQAEETGLYFYRFILHTANGEYETPAYQFTVYEKDQYEPPKWLSQGVMYQIFPDRFNRSPGSGFAEERIPGRERILRDDWGGEPISGPDSSGEVKNNDFFCGNLKGIEEKLPYLENLGVTVIYLNPIFKAYSNHRYDTGNYMEIDPLLGTEEDFKDLCAAAEERGMKIVLDGVFNHTGSDSLYFNKYGSYGAGGAYRDWNSPYKEWYSFSNYPDTYHSWWGIDTLPSVEEYSLSYRDYIIENENSVLRHWLRAGAAGIRLDVADELPDEFIEELRSCLKKEKPDGAVIGEVWEDASNKIAYGRRRKYFQGKQLDSVMNYPLKDAIIAYVGGDKNAERFSEKINSLWENYPPEVFNSLMNILGTHDTERILTVFMNQSGSYEEGRQKLFAALIIWAFMPGIPCIYYGDEIGMTGGRDPENRRCFEYPKGNKEIELFYKRILNLRRKVKNISQMRFSPMAASGGYYSFMRMGEDMRFIFAGVNMNGEPARIKLFDRKEDGRIEDFVICGDVVLVKSGEFIINSGGGIAVYGKYEK